MHYLATGTSDWADLQHLRISGGLKNKKKMLHAAFRGTNWGTSDIQWPGTVSLPSLRVKQPKKTT